MSATGDRRGGAERGFTLIEMLVTLAIASLIAGIGYPAIDRLSSALTLRMGTARALATVGDARAAALAEGRTMVVSAASFGSPAPGVSVAIDQPLIFYRDGSTSGGRIIVRAGRSETRLAVDPQTGALEQLR